MDIAGVLVPEEKSRYRQVPAIEMQRRGVRVLRKICLWFFNKMTGPIGLWIVFDGFFVFHEGIKRSGGNAVISAYLRFYFPFHINFIDDLSL